MCVLSFGMRGYYRKGAGVAVTAVRPACGHQAVALCLGPGIERHRRFTERPPRRKSFCADQAREICVYPLHGRTGIQALPLCGCSHTESIRCSRQWWSVGVMQRAPEVDVLRGFVFVAAGALPPLSPALMTDHREAFLSAS